MTEKRPDGVIAQVAWARRMSMDELAAEYERLFGKKPPDTADQEDLFKRVARRIQEDGGSEPDGKAVAGKRPRPRKVVKAGHTMAGRRLLPGMTLVREYEGKRVSVRVVGRREFEYDGKVYRSLSKIANEITGSHVSGPRWFGLTARRRKK